jgi:SAM domain (Sterile alpha motif)
LDIALDDLDYIGVNKLGHRKIILKSIEDLRKNKRITLNLVASHEGDNATSSANAKAAKVLTSNSAPPSTTKKETIHWSHLEPLAANQVRK